MSLKMVISYLKLNKVIRKKDLSEAKVSPLPEEGDLGEG